MTYDEPGKKHNAETIKTFAERIKEYFGICLLRNLFYPTTFHTNFEIIDTEKTN